MNISKGIAQQEQLQTFLDRKKLQECYGFNKGNWSDLDIFCGDYVNFGFWEGITLNSKISLLDRIKSSESLYLLVAKYLNISQQDTVLEIGCGRGAGLLSLLGKFKPSKAIGIDLSPAQVARAKGLVKHFGQNDNNPVLYSALADHTQLPDQSVDKILSVEVAQHFRAFRSLAQETKRILKPKGKAVFAAHFCTSPENYQKLIDEDLIIKGDHMMPVQFVLKSFEEYGFSIKYHSIGERVFEGFERWAKQTPTTPACTFGIYEAYKKGYLDYFIIEVM